MTRRCLLLALLFVDVGLAEVWGEVGWFVRLLISLFLFLVCLCSGLLLVVVWRCVLLTVVAFVRRCLFPSVCASVKLLMRSFAFVFVCFLLLLLVCWGVVVRCCVLFCRCFVWCLSLFVVGLRDCYGRCRICCRCVLLLMLSVRVFVSLAVKVFVCAHA